MVGRGVAQKNVGCLMELYEDVLQNSLHFPVFFLGLGLIIVQLLLYYSLAVQIFMATFEIIKIA
jgi:hypothetical protein